MKRSFIWLLLIFIINLTAQNGINVPQADSSLIKHSGTANEFERQTTHNIFYQLGEEEQKEYLRNRLTVEITKLGKYADHSSGCYKDYQLSFHWTAFKGINTPISKEEFLNIAGYKQESIQEKNKKEGEKLVGVGAAIMITGLLLAVMPAMITEINTDMTSSSFGKEKHRDHNPVPGLLISGCGVALTIYGYQKKGHYQIPFSVAQNIAGEYNRALLIKMRKSF